MNRNYCLSCRGPCQRPEWITYAGGQNYANNDFRQQMAIARWHVPVTTAAERAAVKAFTLPAAYPCSSCGRHAFPDPGTLCYWCRPNATAVSAALVNAKHFDNEPITTPPARRKRARSDTPVSPGLGL